MTAQQITDKTYSVQIRRMIDSISSLVSIMSFELWLNWNGKI